MTFDPEQDESCLTIEAVSDTITEGTETFVLCLEEFTVSTTVVIQDNNGRWDGRKLDLYTTCVV